MYIDKNIIEELKAEFGLLENEMINTIINNTIWLCPEEIQKEWDDPYTTLEQMFEECYYIVKENLVLFCPPEWFWDGVQESKKELL